MRDIFLTNSLTRNKEKFFTILPGVVLIYTCGPTVYDFAHIGNFRTFVCEDVLLRLLRHLGYVVKHVMNITDVDDKTIKGAVKAGCSLKEFTEKFTYSFFEDLKFLRISPANHYPVATDFINEMINIIKTLEEKGFAYVSSSDNSVYFSIKNFEGYGKLSNIDLDECIAFVQRDDNDEYCNGCVDFVLWKSFNKSRDGDVFWESPWGIGRPGWHIECSAMCNAILGSTVDIHAGGIDNMFPHHENEIAQSNCCFDSVLSNFWIHVDHLLVNNKKMSKREGNFYTLRSLMEDGFDPVIVRYFLLQNHYRMSLNFTIEGLHAAGNAVNRIRSCFKRLKELESFGKTSLNISEEISDNFWSAMCDDLNTPVALAVMFDAVKKVNILINDSALSKEDVLSLIKMFEEFDEIFQILDEEKLSENIPKEILLLIEERDKARAVGDWARSDAIREEIKGMGFVIEDQKGKSSVRRI